MYEWIGSEGKRKIDSTCHSKLFPQAPPAVGERRQHQYLCAYKMPMQINWRRRVSLNRRLHSVRKAKGAPLAQSSKRGSFLSENRTPISRVTSEHTSRYTNRN